MVKVLSIGIVRTGTELPEPIICTLATDLSSFGFFQRPVSFKVILGCAESVRELCRILRTVFVWNFRRQKKKATKKNTLYLLLLERKVTLFFYSRAYMKIQIGQFWNGEERGGREVIFVVFIKIVAVFLIPCLLFSFPSFFSSLLYVLCLCIFSLSCTLGNITKILNDIYFCFKL